MQNHINKFCCVKFPEKIQCKRENLETFAIKAPIIVGIQDIEISDIFYKIGTFLETCNPINF